MTIKELKNATLVEIYPDFGLMPNENGSFFHQNEADPSPFVFYFNGNQGSISGNIFGTKHTAIKNVREVLMKLANPTLLDFGYPNILSVTLYKIEKPIYIPIGSLKVDGKVIYEFKVNSDSNSNSETTCNTTSDSN